MIVDIWWIKGWWEEAIIQSIDTQGKKYFFGKCHSVRNTICLKIWCYYCFCFYNISTWNLKVSLVLKLKFNPEKDDRGNSPTSHMFMSFV